MVSIRLDEELDRMLRRTAQTLRRSKSDVVKASLREYCARALHERQSWPYELIEDLLGRAGSGKGDLSVQGRNYLLETLRAKHARRPR